MGHSFPSLLIQILSISVLIILYVIVTVKLFIKHKHHLEPNHIYELSILSDFVVMLTTVILEKFEWKYDGWTPYCVFVNCVRLSALLSVYADISTSQVDRFYIRCNNTISGIPGGQVPRPLLERRVQREGHHQACRRICHRVRILNIILIK